jgi:hypothetical protein
MEKSAGVLKCFANLATVRYSRSSPYLFRPDGMSISFLASWDKVAISEEISDKLKCVCDCSVSVPHS